MQLDRTSSHSRIEAAIARGESFAKKHSLGLVLVTAVVAHAQPKLGLFVRHANLGHVPVVGWSYDLLTLALSLIMLSASVQCQPRDFLEVASSRAKVPFTLSVYVVGPLVGVAMAAIALRVLGADTAQPIALGLVLLGLMPIAMTSAAWVRMNAGNVPLLLGAIVLTNTVAVPLVPLILRRVASAVHAATGAPMHAGPVVQQLTLAILLPVALGLALRSYAPRFVDRARPTLSLLSTASLLLSLGSTVSASRPHVEAHQGALGAALVFTLAFNGALYVAGLAVVRQARLDRAESITVLFASGMRNMGAAMVVAAVAFPDLPLVAIPAAIFSISQQVLGGLVSSLVNERPGWLTGEASIVPGEMRPRASTIPSLPPPPA